MLFIYPELEGENSIHEANANKQDKGVVNMLTSQYPSKLKKQTSNIYTHGIEHV